jgi:WD40 repeat protein
MIGIPLVALVGLLLTPSDAPAKPPRPLGVRSLTFSPDGARLVVAAGGRNQPGVLLAWDVRSRKRLWQIRGAAGFASVSFAPDGKSIAVAHGKPTALRLDAATGRTLGTVGPHPATVHAVVHVPGTNQLAIGSDGIIRLWDVKRGRVVRELKGHPAEVHALFVSPDGKWLVSRGPDGTRIWDRHAGTAIQPAVRRDLIVFVSPSRVMLGDNWGVQRVLQLPAGTEVLRFKNSGAYAGAAYSSAAGLAAYRGYDSAEIALADLTFRAPTADEAKRIERLLTAFDDEAYRVRVAASASMRKLGSVAEPALRDAMTHGPSAEVRMRAREARRAILEEPLRRLAGHGASIGALAFSPDGTILATGTGDGTVRLWNPRTGEERARLEVADTP